MKAKSKSKIVLFLSLFLLCSQFLFFPKPVRAETEDLPAGSYLAIYWDLSKGDELDFGASAETTLYDNTITVYVMDSANYSNYQNAQSYETFISKETIYSTEFTFIAPYDDTFYVIIENDWDQEQTVSYDYSITEFTPYPTEIDVLNPTSSSKLKGESDGFYITWDVTDEYCDYVIIELYKGDTKVETIASKESNDRGYNEDYGWHSDYYWSTEINKYENGDNYRIKVTDYNNESLYGFSEEFAIQYQFESWTTVWEYVIFLGIPVLAAVIGIGFYIRHRKKKAIAGGTQKEEVEPQKIEQKAKEKEQITPAGTGKMYCPQCGSEIAADSKFCRSCGSEIK